LVCRHPSPELRIPLCKHPLSLACLHIYTFSHTLSITNPPASLCKSLSH
jgi:hypothetical protein